MNIAARDPVPVRLRQCARVFDDGTRALQAIDLEVQAGETLVLLGPSGCGKTTLLRIVAGLDYPEPGGEVWFGDENVTALPIERRGVGMVFQSYALFPNMTVAENIAYGLRIRKVDPQERARRVAELAELVHLGDLLQRRIDQLSGGQRQRVALARAIAVEPRVLLLDEPLTALDAKLRETLRVEIDRLLRSLGITSIYVTHDQAEAMALGDRIVVMEHGRIAQIGTPHEIWHSPATGFVAEFVGTVNRMAASVRDGAIEVAGGRLALDPDWGEFDEIMFRPHEAQIAGDDAQLRGTVIAALFLGDRTRVVVDTGGERPIIVDTAQARVPQADEPIGLRLAPGAFRPFPRQRG